MKKVKASELRAREKFLLEVTSLPVAAGHEGSVISLVEGWAARRKLELSRDKSGNLVLTRKDFKRSCRKTPPLFITAHMDHPAFVVLSVKGSEVKLEFRGGVQDAYFKDANIEIFDPELKENFAAKIVTLDPAVKPFKTALARLGAEAPQLKAGCIGRWKFPPAAVKKGVAYTQACDDLASVAAALTAYENISRDKKLGHVALLFTRAEEVGFVGAIGAARGGTIPKNARLICLECSRSFPHDSPIGAGPIVRVGDRMSVFTPELTNLVSNAAAAYQKKNPAFKFQRKLMPGGVCEASAFSFYGLRSTCLCLPLGNYHNMADLDGVAKGKKARPGQEYVSVSDFHGLVELLGVLARSLDAPGPTPRQSMEKIWSDRAFVVGR